MRWAFVAMAVVALGQPTLAATPTARTACQRDLAHAGVEARTTLAPGVPEPLALPSRIGQVTYAPLGNRGPLVADCLLARALVRASPILAGFGVVTAHYSRSYTAREKLGNKRSPHQWARAIDIHEF